MDPILRWVLITASIGFGVGGLAIWLTCRDWDSWTESCPRKETS